jgi:hypothetical protein
VNYLWDISHILYLEYDVSTIRKDYVRYEKHSSCLEIYGMVDCSRYSFGSSCAKGTYVHTQRVLIITFREASRSFEPRHVIADTRISSGQGPRCDVTLSQCDTRDF